MGDLSFQGCFSQRLPLLFWPLCRPKTHTTAQTDGFGMRVMGDVENAGILCASHGGWIVEIPHPPVNYWIKAKLLDLYTPDKQEKAGVPWGNLFWMGAVTEDRHDDHVNGNWWWPHANASVQWFDWGDNEPNDLHGQNCMTYMEYRDVIFQNYRDYFWNDSDCKNDVAHYICVKDCADCPEQGTTPSV